MVRAVHFDCFSGISGDMTLGALIDAGADAGAVRAGLDSLGLPIRLEVARVRKGGFAATQVFIHAPEQEEHRFLPDVEEILGRGILTEKQRALALRIFRRLAEAESAVHGMPLERVHFHEVGALDSIADIAGVAIALDTLGIEHFTSRSVPTGSGTVKCAHGIMPIPTPATAELLKGAPLAPSTIKAELTTPTGAAILATTVKEWTETPVMTVRNIGHGAGTKDFLDQPNLLRVFVGEMAQVNAGQADQVWVLETNLDDVPAEVVGYCFEQLFAAGALDVYVHHADPDEEEPAGHAAERACPGRRGRCAGSDSFPRDGDVRHPPVCRAAEQASARVRHRRDALGSGSTASCGWARWWVRPCSRRNTRTAARVSAGAWGAKAATGVCGSVRQAFATGVP